MNWLKRIPMDYYGELHDVKLIQFSVELAELEPMLPKELKARNFDGRGLISMVNVKLKKMHPGFLHSSLGCSYQHVAFRLLLEDAPYNQDHNNKGIYFLKSFTTRPLVVHSGNLMTDYELSTAKINDKNNLFELNFGDKYVRYALGEGKPAERKDWLKKEIKAIDRAYNVLDQDVRVTEIKRKGWPIEWADCYHFETNFFETARLEGAFQVDEVVHYQWLAARAVKPCA
jgi:hypothetical protein